MIFALSIAAFQGTELHIPVREVRDAGFSLRVFEHTSRRDKSVMYAASRTDSSRISFKVDFNGVDTPNGRIREGNYSAVYKEGTTTPSGLCVGTDSFFYSDTGTLSWTAITRTEWIHISLSGPHGTSDRGFYETRPHDYTNDKKLLERLMRRTVALTGGQRVKDFRTRAVAGHSVSSGVCERSGRVFGDFAAWCTARGWTLTHNADYDYFTIRKGSKYAVVPLGSAKVKVNGTWRDGVDSVVLCEGKWYLTRQALEAIRDGED